MSFTGSFNFSGMSPGRSGVTPGRMRGSLLNSVNYPSPFFDVAHTYLPTTMKSLFRYCRYYFLTNPLINATVFKLSEYPITDIVIDHKDDKVKKRWMEYFHDHLRYRSFQVETGLDYHCYGNCPISIRYPFHKYLTCRTCRWSERAKRIKNLWTFTNFEYRLNCPNCSTTGDADVYDHYYPDASGISLRRWDVENLEITHNEHTNEFTHFYTLPNTLQSDITIGKKDVLDSIPAVFVQAMRQRKGIIFSKDNFFHLRRPTIAGKDQGWGIPLVMPVLKDTFYLQIMKKAQEAILLEHIVPLRAIFPQAASGTSDPFTTLNLSDWRDQVAAEIARWRYDNNYIPIMPIPLGQQSIGGDGKALLMFNEMQMQSEHIIMGMGVPREFLMGGLSFSGSNVSMRMLENAFVTYIGHQRALARWVMREVANYMSWPEATIRFKPFKMADDLQRKTLRLQMSQLQKISDTTLLADDDLDQAEENELMAMEAEQKAEGQKKQQIATAEIQGETQLIMAKYQAKAQKVMMEAQQDGNMDAPGVPGGPDGADPVASQLNAGQQLGATPNGNPASGGDPNAGMDINVMAQSYAEQISQMPPDQQQQALSMIEAQSPELAQLVQQYLGQMQAQQPQVGGVDNRPLPEKLPPRRLGASI